MEEVQKLNPLESTGFSRPLKWLKNKKPKSLTDHHTGNPYVTNRHIPNLAQEMEMI